MEKKGGSGPSTQPVVNGKCDGSQGAIRLIGWQGAVGFSISKKNRDIFDIPDEGIINNRMIIIEMKGIVKMIRIRQKKQD